MPALLSVLRVFALVLLIFGATMLLPVAASLGLRDGAEFAFDEAIVITVGCGLLLWWATRNHTRDLRIKDGFLLVVVVWVGLPVFASVPLLAFFWPKLSFTDAYFETVSGLTTTGATVLEGLDALPYSINLWRAELVWLGGMGLIVLAVAILPLLGVGGRQLFKAEAPGPMKESKLTPRMEETAKGLWLVYAAISAACLVAFHLAGMELGDSLIHTFTVMGLGGFSSHDASFGYFNSVPIEAVAIFFMTVAGMNFATHFLAWRQRGIRPYFADPEALWYLGMMYGSVLFLAVYLWSFDSYPDFLTALRFSAFNVVSIATTTGYANYDYSQWPIFVPLWMLFLCSFATCSGSTGGGIKMARAMILYRQVIRELVRSAHPKVVHPVKFGREAVPTHILFAVMAFGFIYMAILVTLTLLLSLSGLEVVTAFSAAVACLNNTGPGLNQVGPATTYASLDDLQTWICTIAMLLGRLEIFTLLVVLNPSFWRN